MDNTKQINLVDDVVLESEDNTTPLTRFEEYVRYSEKIRSENNDIDSAEVD